MFKTIKNAFKTPEIRKIVFEKLKSVSGYAKNVPGVQKIIDDIINDLLSKKYTQKQIEEKYDVNQQLITSINRGVTHRREGLDYPIIKTSNYHCDEKVFEEIVYLLKYSTCTCAEIGAYFGFSTSTIKAINSGRNHHDDNIVYPIRNFRGKSGSQPVEAILAKRSTPDIDTLVEM